MSSAAAQVEEDLELQALRARAEATDCPPGMDRRFCVEWLAFADAPPPRFVRGAAGLTFSPLEMTEGGEKIPDKQQYATFFKPEYAAGRMRLRCLVVGCTQKAALSYQTVSADGAVTYPFATPWAHFVKCGGPRLLKVSDAVKFAAAAGSKRREPDEDDSAGSSSGRISEDAHLAFLRMTKDEYLRAALRAHLADGEPLGSDERVGARSRLAALALPIASRMTMERLFVHELENLVHKPVRAEIAAALQPRTMNIRGMRFELQPRVVIGCDGVKVGLATFESMFIVRPQVTRPVILKDGFITQGRGPPQLRPKYTVLGLAWWQAGVGGGVADEPEGGGYTASAHANMLIKMVRTQNLEPERVRMLMMDTTAGNGAVVATPPWAHAVAGECWQHLLMLCMEDLLGNVNFKSAHDAALELSVWLRRAAKRIEAAMKFIQLRPIAPSKTRFGQRVLVIERTIVNSSGFAKMSAHLAEGKPLFNGLLAKDDAATVAGFQSRYTAMLVNKPVLEALAKLKEPFMACVTAMGSEELYTPALQYKVFEIMWGAAESLRRWDTGDAVDAVRSIGVDLQNSLLERLSTVALATMYFKSGVHISPTWNKVVDAAASAAAKEADVVKQKKKIKKDSRMFAAMALYPPAFYQVPRRGPPDFMDAAVTYMYEELLVPCISYADLPQPPPPAPKNKTEMAALIAAARAKPNPYPGSMSESAWKAIIESEVRSIRSRFGDANDFDDVGGGGSRDPYGPLLDQLRDEAEQHAEMCKAAFLKHLELKDAYKSPYGTELSPTDACYEFWPANEERMPILSWCAQQLLAGDTGATCFSERMHSPVGRICNKFRASSKPDKISNLTLAYFLEREAIKEDVRLRKVTHEMLDAEELAEDMVDDSPVVLPTSDVQPVGISSSSVEVIDLVR